jgi:hypothetical protein
LEGERGALKLTARMNGVVCRISETSDGHHYFDGSVTLAVSASGVISLESDYSTQEPHLVDMGHYHALATLLRGITSAGRVHVVNTRLLVEL